MKKGISYTLLILFSLLMLLPVLGYAQPGTWPIRYSDEDPTTAPSGAGTRVYFNTATNTLFFWEPAPSSQWRKQPKAFEQITGCAAPAYTPTARQSTFAVNSCDPPELYQYTGSAWELLNAGTTYTAGTGIDITAGVISNTGDLSTTNELNTAFSVIANQLRITDAGGSINVPIPNIAPVQAVSAGTGISISGITTRLISIPPDGITSTEIASGAVGASELASTAVSAGTYTYMTGTVDSDGRLTAASNGTAPVAGTGANGRAAFWTGSTTQSSDGSWLWNNTTKRMTIGNYGLASGLDISGSQSINPGGYTPSAGTNALLEVQASPNNTGINDVAMYGIRSVPSLINDGTPTGSSLYAVQGTASVTTPTKATIAAAANFGGSNTSVNLSQFYGVYGRIDEKCITGNLGNRAALRFDMIKADAGAGVDSHSGTGAIVNVSDNSTGGRWLSGRGLSAAVSNAKTATGAYVSTSHTRGTGNNAYGVSVSSSASGSGVVVDNAYGITLDVSTSVATISNYYGISLTSVPSGTTSWYLYNSTAAKSYLSGDVGIGTALPSQKLDVNGNARFRALTGFNVSSPASTIDAAGPTGYSQLRLQTTYTPTSSADALGATGDTAWDANYFYIKTAEGWKRAALSTF